MNETRVGEVGMVSQMERRLSVWAVIPAYNEADRIGRVVQGVLAAGLNVVVVDDGSRDGTADRAAQHPVWVLRHPINCGQGAGLQTGIDFALSRRAGVIVTIDADGQHDPAEIHRLIDPIARGEADVTLGSRFLGKTSRMPFSRWLLLRAAVWFTRRLSGLRLTDVHNGFRAFSRHAASSIRISQPRMAHASEILDEIVRHRLRYVEAPVTITYSDATLRKGQSAWDAFRIGGNLMLGRLIK